MKRHTILLIARYRSGEPPLLPALAEHYTIVLTPTRKEAANTLKHQDSDLVLIDVPTIRFDLERFWKDVELSASPPRLFLLLAADTRPGQGLHAAGYLCYPFSSRQLLRRLARILPDPPEIASEGPGLHLDSDSNFLIWKNAQIPLTPKQARLAQAFLSVPNQVLSRAQLMQQVWGTDYLGDTRTLDVHIHWLRRALSTLEAPFHLETRRGQGYCLIPDPDSP